MNNVKVSKIVIDTCDVLGISTSIILASTIKITTILIMCGIIEVSKANLSGLSRFDQVTVLDALFPSDLQANWSVQTGVRTGLVVTT